MRALDRYTIDKLGVPGDLLMESAGRAVAADVLVYLRPRLKEALRSEDERDLFKIANNFGIRHHNQTQKTDYDKPIWYSWMFYYYLATLHAALRLIAKRERGQPPAA